MSNYSSTHGNMGICGALPLDMVWLTNENLCESVSLKYFKKQFTKKRKSCHAPMPTESQVKFHNQENVSGASQQNNVTWLFPELRNFTQLSVSMRQTENDLGLNCFFSLSLTQTHTFVCHLPTLSGWLVCVSYYQHILILPSWNNNMAGTQTTRQNWACSGTWQHTYSDVALLLPNPRMWSHPVWGLKAVYLDTTQW